MDSEYSVLVSNKFAGLLVDEEDPAEIINGAKEKSKDEDLNRKDAKKKQIAEKKFAKSAVKDASSKKENVNDENKKDSKFV